MVEEASTSTQPRFSKSELKEEKKEENLSLMKSRLVVVMKTPEPAVVAVQDENDE